MAFLNDEEKKVLLERYLDIEWPDDIADLRCVRCQRVVIDHHVSNCQHLFCNNCRRVFSDGGQWKCPQCQQCVTQLDDQDFDVEIKMHQLRIFCPNKKYGCKYEDQLRNIPKHLTTCADTRQEALPVEYTETNTIDAVDKQFIKVNAAIGELKEGTSSQFREQGKKIDDMNSKLNVLTETMNSLEKKSEELEQNYKDGFRSIKSLLESANERSEQNESLIQEMMEQMSLNMEKMRNKMGSMTQEVGKLQFKKSEELNPAKAETYEWTIKDVAKTILKDDWRFESEAFAFTGCKYEIRAKLQKQVEDAAISIQFKAGNTYNKFLNRNGFTIVKYIVKDHRSILKKEDIIRKCYLRFSHCFGHRSWIFAHTLPGDILSQPYVMHDCIKITISFEPPSIDHSFFSNNGVLNWRVDNYKARKEERLYYDTWSPSFYTSPQGYRVKCRLRFHFKRPTSVDVHFLTGEHDDSLSINFPHKTTVTLYNQLDPSKNLVKSEHLEDVKLYSIQLESSTFIEENGFVKDDSLLLTVVIEPVVK